jgi:hypothetical protein
MAQPSLRLIYVSSAPSGSCNNAASMQRVISTGHLYSCQSGTWADISGSGGVVTVVGAGTLCNTAIVTGGGLQTIQTPSCTSTLSAAGNFSTQGSVTTGVGGSVAGGLEVVQGSSNTPDANSILIEAPASVPVAYRIRLPAASASGLWLASDAANINTTTFLAVGAGVSTWITTPSSANLAAALTDETGSGAAVFANTPTLIAPLLGTPTSGVMTNVTGLTEFGQTLADVTTLNASTSMHGYAPKLPNDATKYYNGTGGFTVPAGGGGLGYSLTFTGPVGLNPTGLAASTTYYLGATSQTGWLGQANEGVSRVYVPQAGTIKTAFVAFSHTVPGTSETSTISIRVSDTTDTAISSAVTNDSANTVFSNTALSIAVLRGDFLEIKWVTPAWVAAPTGVHATVTVSIQ